MAAKKSPMSSEKERASERSDNHTSRECSCWRVSEINPTIPPERPHRIIRHPRLGIKDICVVDGLEMGLRNATNRVNSAMNTLVSPTDHHPSVV